MYFKTISYTFKKLLYLLRSYPWSWDVKQASCTSHAHPDKEHCLQPLPDGTLCAASSSYKRVPAVLSAVSLGFVCGEGLSWAGVAISASLMTCPEHAGWSSFSTHKALPASAKTILWSPSMGERKNG